MQEKERSAYLLNVTVEGAGVTAASASRHKEAKKSALRIETVLKSDLKDRVDQVSGTCFYTMPQEIYRNYLALISGTHRPRSGFSLILPIFAKISLA